MTKRLAEWRLERGSSILVLEQLNGSSTLANTILSQVMLHSCSILGVILVLLWAFSPIGGQSPLQVLTTTTTINSSTESLQFANLDTGTLFIGADNVVTYGGYVETIYSTSIIAASTGQNLSMDTFNNIRLPAIKYLGNQTNLTGWVSIPESNIIYSSLTGIPITGLDSPGNISFLMNTSYYDLTIINGSTQNLHLNGSGISVNFTSNNSSVNGYPPVNVILSPIAGSSQVSFSWIQIFAECQVMCIVTTTSADQRSCAVQAMRQTGSGNPPFLANALSLYAIIQPMWNKLLSGQNFSLSEAYLRHPEAPLDANLSDPTTTSPSAHDLEVRFAQLFNTYMYGTNDPFGILSGVPTTAVNASGTRAYFGPDIYVVDFSWLTVFTVATSILTLCGAITVVLDLISLNPDILGYVSTLLGQNSSYLSLPVTGSTLEGEEKTRLLKSVAIRLGDVQIHEAVGRLSIGTPQTTERVYPGRLYQ